MPKKGMEPIRKAAIIEATIAEIGTQGTLNVTVNQIATRAGVSSALAHHYFGGKEDLFLEAMRHTLRVYGDEARKLLQQADTAKARVEAVISASFGPENFSQATISAWLNFYVFALKSNKAHRLWLIYQRRIRSNLVHGLRPMIGSRAPEAAARIIGLIDGLYLREALAPSRFGPKHATTQVLEALSNELRALP